MSLHTWLVEKFLFRESPDQNRLITNSRPTTSISTQDENSKIVPVLDVIENDNSEKSDFKDDGSYIWSISKITNPSTGQWWQSRKTE